MSGHSHWATIKHKKGAADARRSNEFAKLAKELTVAARDGGGNPDTNPRLRQVVEKAKNINMPSDNVERAIKRGTGEGSDASQLEEVLLEAYGPEGSALLIEAITDNKNRTLGELKQTLQKNGGKLVEGGAVRWMFDRKGVITIMPGKEAQKEDIELAAIEAGAENLYWHEGFLDLHTKPEELEGIKAMLPPDWQIESQSLDWVPKEHASVSPESQKALEKLFEELDENDSVQDVYSSVAL